MTYTADSPILGNGKATAGQIDAFFAVKGQQLAPNYAPDGTYKPAPAGLGHIIIDMCREWHTVNHDIVTAQIIKESAAWQSQYARERNNPSGLGAVNDNPDNAIWFDAPADGVRATVAHLLTYAVGNGDWTMYDPRYDATPTAWHGIAQKLRDLDGRWAWPGNGYGASIAEIANQLLTTKEDEGPMIPDDPRFAWVPDVSEFGYPKGTHGRNGKPIELLVVHITEGTDSLGWLVGNNGSSAHYLSDRMFNPRAQMVAESDAAWTGGNREYNERGIHVEFEIKKHEPISDQQFRNAAKLVVPILRRNDIQPVYLGRDNGRGKNGIIGHADIPDPDGSGWGGSSNRPDPGPHWDWPRFISYIHDELGMAVVPQLPKASPDPWRESNPYSHDYWIPDVFIENIHDWPWMATGFAVSEAFVRGNQIVQFFERARLEWDGIQVTRGLVGYESMICEFPERDLNQ